jgi:flap endonuclease-1
MGIKNLMQIIKKYAPTSLSLTEISKYRNCVIAIDANLLIYKMIFAVRKNGYDLKNEAIVVTHLFTLLQKIKGFIKYNITPVFVFDGMPPQIKETTLKQRQIFFNTMQQKYYKAITQDEKKKYYFMKSEITLKEINECIELIKIFNYTQIESPEEADSQLADLIKKKKVDYIATDDMDILVFGGNKILKNFTVSNKKKIQEIDLNKFKKETGLTQNELVDLSILLGCDYCPSIKGVGTIGSYKLIQEYKSIENIIKKEHLKITFDYNKAKKYFKNPPITDSDKITVNKLKVNKNELKSFLEKYKFKQKYIEDLLNMLK